MRGIDQGQEHLLMARGTRASSFDGKPTVTSTGLDREALVRLFDCLQFLGGSYSRQLSDRVTHVILCANSQGQATHRTAKYLEAKLSKMCIVSLRWVEESLLAGRWLSEDAFLVFSDSAGAESPFLHLTMSGTSEKQKTLMSPTASTPAALALGGSDVAGSFRPAFDHFQKPGKVTGSADGIEFLNGKLCCLDACHLSTAVPELSVLLRLTRLAGGQTLSWDELCSFFPGSRESRMLFTDTPIRAIGSDTANSSIKEYLDDSEPSKHFNQRFTEKLSGSLQLLVLCDSSVVSFSMARLIEENGALISDHVRRRVLPVRWFLDCISALQLLPYPSLREAFSSSSDN